MQAVETVSPLPRRGEGLPRHVRVLRRLSARGLPRPVCEVSVERAVEVPAADGVTLLTDHYAPAVSGPAPTLLARTPYGRGFPWDYLFGALFAGQGFHVVIQSCRGTGGSGGEYDPGRSERADGQAAVAWLRDQEWFNGALGTIGPSYLGYTQWALAADPPPQLRAMVVQNGVHDLYGVIYPGGAFALEAMLTVTAAQLAMQHGFGRFLRAVVRLLRHHRRATGRLPLVSAYPPALGGRVRHFEDWLAHPGPGDPFWRGLDAGPAAESLAVPVSLVAGWQDICLDQTLQQYGRLRRAGCEARLLIGPWDHSSGFSKDLPAIVGDALAWLRAHLLGERDGLPAGPVRVHVSGAGEWRDLADWPPPGTRFQTWRPHPDGTLRPEAPARAAASSFRYDPAAPTPSVGGAVLNSRTVGARRNNALEARPDVLVFTTAPLAGPLEVIGPVSLRLRVRGASPHFDVFARLCDVDARGRSWNVCDGLIRRRPGDSRESGAGAGGAGAPAAAGAPWSAMTVPMSSTAHRFEAGHRLRLQISGGAHPRFARNTGTGEPPATAARLVPVEVEVGHGPDPGCGLSLPVPPGS